MLALLIVVWATFPSPVLSLDPIRVQNNAHSYAFGQEVRFLLQVTGDAPIESILLTYQTTDAAETQVKPLAFDRGQVVSVEFSGADGKSEPIDGKITVIASVADAASDTLNVRVEVPNVSLRPAGEHVKVRFPSALPKNNIGEKPKVIAENPANETEQEGVN